MTFLHVSLVITLRKIQTLILPACWIVVYSHRFLDRTWSSTCLNLGTGTNYLYARKKQQEEWGRRLCQARENRYSETAKVQRTQTRRDWRLNLSCQTSFNGPRVPTDTAHLDLPMKPEQIEMIRYIMHVHLPMGPRIFHPTCKSFRWQFSTWWDLTWLKFSGAFIFSLRVRLRMSGTKLNEDKHVHSY